MAENFANDQEDGDEHESCPTPNGQCPTGAEHQCRGDDVGRIGRGTAINAASIARCFRTALHRAAHDMAITCRKSDQPATAGPRGGRVVGIAIIAEYR